MDNSQILQQAVTAIKAGDKATGQKLLIPLVQANPRNEYAWLWLSVTMDDPAKRRQCLERVLAINPNNGQAKQGLAKFQTQSPQPLEKLKVEPPLKPIEPPPEPVSLPQSLPATNMQWVNREQLKARLEETSSSPPPALPKQVKPLRQIKPVKSSSKVEKKPSQPKPEVSDRKLIEQYIARMTRQGWQVISQTETTVQLRKPKKWSSGLLILGALLLIVFGVGLIFLLLALIDYALKKEQVIYVTADELREGTAQKTASSWTMPIVVAGGIVGLCFLCYLPSLILGVNPSSTARTPRVSEATPTPTKTPLSPTPVNSIGVSRAAIQSVFGSEDIGFTFKPVTGVEGQPRVMGESRNGLALIELIGPPENLTSVTMAIGTPSDNPEALLENSVYMLGLLNLVTPDWEGGSDWLTENAERAEARTSYKNLEITLYNDKNTLGLMTLTIKAK